MKVFKFGGASVNSKERIKNLKNILHPYETEKILLVVSAMGKTTNALEKVAEAFYNRSTETALQLFETIKQNHLSTAKDLLLKSYNETLVVLNNFFTEVEWLLHEKPVREFDYYYDQIVCIGELLSSAIVSTYLFEEGISNQWMDVRDIFRTDDTFRDAKIDWTITEQRVKDIVRPVLQKKNFVITQGFIGSTDENESTTLGREGSDYTAAIFANLLNAQSLTIWKDVEGVMNSDPKEFPEAELISELNYAEVIEMAYYGAQVIHPKTIKPLQNKNIPLYVKCFLNPALPGTVIHNKSIKGLPPIIVIKQNQVLVYLNSRDFSFVGERPVGQLYHLFEDLKIRPNLTQNAAITFTCCLDDHPEKIQKLALAASDIFDVQVEKGLTLLTIRHYKDELFKNLTSGKQVILQQQSGETLQAIIR